MPKVSTNIESLLAQCDRIYAAFQADQVPTELPNWEGAVYHQSYLLGRISDLRAIIERLGTQNAELIGLAHSADKLMPRVRPPKRYSKKLQAVYQREGRMTSLMQLDMESLLVFGNMTLDQWALFFKYRHEVAGSQKNWRYPFSELHRQVINHQNQNQTIVKLRSLAEIDIWWLQFNVRSYRNTFIEHLDRPWQRGSTRPRHVEGFSFFVPTVIGSSNKVDAQAVRRTVEHLRPPSLKNLPPDDWQQSPAAVVQWLMHNIDTIPVASDRELIGAAWERIGGETVSYLVMAKRILHLLETAVSI